MSFEPKKDQNNPLHTLKSFIHNTSTHTKLQNILAFSHWPGDGVSGAGKPPILSFFSFWRIGDYSLFLEPKDFWFSFLFSSTWGSLYTIKDGVGEHCLLFSCWRFARYCVYAGDGRMVRKKTTSYSTYLYSRYPPFYPCSHNISLVLCYYAFFGVCFLQC